MKPQSSESDLPLKTETKLHTVPFWPLLVLAMLVNILAQSTHEAGHHVFYQVMGRQPVWAFTRLVQLWETTPTNTDGWTEKINPDGSKSWLKISSPVVDPAEVAVVSAAGPLAGLLSAVLGLIMVQRSRLVVAKQIWLAFALSASLAAVLYYLRSPMRTGGDEFDIAAYFGLSKSLIEILGLAFTFCLVIGLGYLPAWRSRLYWIGTILLGSTATGIAMAMLDPLVIAQFDAGNPLFQNIGGYVLPVLVVIIMAFIGIAGWSRWSITWQNPSLSPPDSGA